MQWKQKLKKLWSWFWSRTHRDQGMRLLAVFSLVWTLFGMYQLVRPAPKQSHVVSVYSVQTVIDSVYQEYEVFYTQLEKNERHVRLTDKIKA